MHVHNAGDSPGHWDEPMKCSVIKSFDGTFHVSITILLIHYLFLVNVILVDSTSERAAAASVGEGLICDALNDTNNDQATEVMLEQV